MRRLHAAKQDLDWLPPRYRRLRGAIVGTVWTTIGGSAAALMLFGHVYYLGGKLIVSIAAGGYWLGDRVSKGIVKSRLGELASGKVDLAHLSNSDDGELVHVRGTVRATSTLGSHIGAANGVYRRLRVAFGEVQAIEEEAVDFQLVDAEGTAIIVEVDNARWLVHDAKLQKTTYVGLERFAELEPVAKFFKRRGRWLYRNDRTRVAEAMLRDGDEVEVVGYKSRRVDQSMANRMERETPMRATLRGGKELPVMISRVRAAP